VNFKRVADSPSSEQWQGRPVPVLALERRHALLLHMAWRAQERGSALEAAGFLQQAAGPDFPVPLRLRAQVRLAETWERAGQAAKAIAAWQGLLLDDNLRAGVLFPGHLPPQAAAAFAEGRIQELRRKNGASVDAEFEKQAKEAHRRAQGTIAGLEKLAR